MDLSYVSGTVLRFVYYNLVNLYCLDCSKVELLNDVYLIIVHMR